MDLVSQLQQQSINQPTKYSIRLENIHQNRVGIKISLISAVQIESPLQALENFVHSANATPKLNHKCEVSFSLPKCV